MQCLTCSDDGNEKPSSLLILDVRPHFGRSVYAKPRGSHRPQTLSGGFSGLCGHFPLPFRIGSVIREQRPAAATTRTTVVLCIVNRILRQLNRKAGDADGVTTFVFVRRVQSCSQHREQRWSSRTRPVNRLQATGEPRRVMRVGSKGYMLGSEGTGQTRKLVVTNHRESCCFHQRNRRLIHSLNNY